MTTLRIHQIRQSIELAVCAHENGNGVMQEVALSYLRSLIDSGFKSFVYELITKTIADLL